MLKISSKDVEARARSIEIVHIVNVVSVSGLEPPLIPESVNQEGLEHPAAPQKDMSAHEFFWLEPGQRVPSEIRWIWNPMTGDAHVGTQSRHSGMTPSGTDWDSVLRGFYFPDKKMVAIRSYYWPNGAYDQWDEGHSQLNADIQMAFVMAVKPTLQQQDPGVDFSLNIDNGWLRATGRYSW